MIRIDLQTLCKPIIAGVGFPTIIQPISPDLNHIDVRTFNHPSNTTAQQATICIRPANRPLLDEQVECSFLTLNPNAQSRPVDAEPATHPESLRPKYCLEDINGLNAQQTAAFLLTIYGEDFLKNLDYGSINDIKAISLIFRLEENGNSKSLREIATGFSDGEVTAYNRDTTQYSLREISAITSQPIKDVESLLLNLGIDEELALQTARQLTGDNYYKMLGIHHENNSPAVISMVDKAKLTDAQESTRNTFPLITSLPEYRDKYRSEINKFLGLQDDRTKVSRLSKDDVNQRIVFLEHLLAKKSPFKFYGSNSLENEWYGYSHYNASHQDNQRLADMYLENFSESNINNYYLKGKIVTFLEERHKVKDVAAIDFIYSLHAMKSDFNIEGTERLFEKAFKSLNDVGIDTMYGLYYESSVALNLASIDNGVTVKAVSVKELERESGQTVQVNDIDIYAIKDHQTCHIEVTSSAHGACNDLGQIERNVKSAKKYNAIPVLIPGNIGPIVGTTERFIRNEHLRQAILNTPHQLDHLNQLIRVRDLMSNPQIRGLNIWDENGKPLHNRIGKITRKYKNIRAEMVAA